MPRSKKYDRYPPVFTETVDKLVETMGKPIEVPFAEKAHANTFRLDFYSFINAADADPRMRESHARYSILQEITIAVKDNPPRAIISLRSHGTSAQALEKVLEQLK